MYILYMYICIYYIYIYRPYRETLYKDISLYIKVCAKRNLIAKTTNYIENPIFSLN